MGERSTPDAQVETSASTRERDNGTSRVDLRAMDLVTTAHARPPAGGRASVSPA